MRELPEPLTIEEVLGSCSMDIHVPEGRTMTLGPFESPYSEAFRLGEVTSFEDLHRLGFIHEGITEEEITNAIRADERVFRESLRRQRMGGESTSSCSCEDPGARHPAEITRRQVQDHLIDLLQPLFQDSIRPDDPVVVHSFRHARTWMARPSRFIVGIYALNDIDIGDAATLTMTPTVQALYANDITIGRKGRLRFTSGGVHVRCRTLNGPSLFSDVTNLEKYVKNLSRETREIQP